jgi:hypothetical protein
MSRLDSTRRFFFAFIILSCLPASAFLLVINYVYIAISSRNSVHKRLKRTPGFKPKTILITGISTRHGLKLARAFYRTGHLVIGADGEPEGLPTPARCSRALTRFHNLACDFGDHHDAEYIARLVHVVEFERADLWINCNASSDISLETRARDVIQQYTKCQCFALLPEHMPFLAGGQALLDYLMGQGLPVPESYRVTSRAEIHKVLSRASGTRKFFLQSVEQNGVNANTRRTLLPRRTMSQTYDMVSRISIADTTPWRLEQDINDLEKYSTFAVIVSGNLKVFAANRVRQDDMCQALDPKSTLFRSMMRFVETFARRQGSKFTTHLGVDFCVDEYASEAGVTLTILPVKISVHIQDSVFLLQGMDGAIQLTRAYLAPLVAKTDQPAKMIKSVPAARQPQTLPDEVAIPDGKTQGIYTFGPNVVSGVIRPLYSFCKLHISGIETLRQMIQFLGHLLFWQDDLYDPQDPLPFWISYQIYTPLQILRASLQQSSIAA